MNQSIIILGSTGSIGLQSVDVAIQNGIPVCALSANKNVEKIEAQARSLGVSACAMADPSAADALKIKLADTKIRVYSGIAGICEMIDTSDAKTVINAIIGEAGLLPTLACIRSGKRLALANKESLVVAGETVMREARNFGTEIVPVDSEHCAIHQCLKAGTKAEVKKLILTASGGPFFNKKAEDLQNVTISDVLAHPTWSMGAKITVDSATLMNKGFEAIEAMHLFNVGIDQIDVVVHRESIIHSMVEYIDNSVIAQLSTPDMRFCIQYALTYPERTRAVSKPLNLTDIGRLSFRAPDTGTFSLLSAAFRAAEKGGALPAVLNAANEVAVEQFLLGHCGFLQITEAVLQVMEKMQSVSKHHSLEEILAADREARRRTAEWLCHQSSR